MGSAPSGAGRRLSWLPLLRELRRRRSVILGYHGVAESDRRLDLSRLQVAPSLFRRQLELLAQAGFRFMTMRDATDELTGAAPRPGIAVVTFDDGLRNNHTTAAPILAELGIPATVYVACDFIAGHNPWIAAGGGGEMLTEDEIKALARASWEIGAHTLSHADLASLDYDGCLAEIDGSRRLLEQITATTVDAFAYPFGRYGPAAIAAARDAGMRTAVTTGSGCWRPFELTRAMISAGDPGVVVALKLVDRYEPLLRLAPLRAARSASRTARARIQGAA
ncbi:MAG: polysaccharide deacetylase family protein [Solirubrobacteraceae bacterium]